MVKKRGLGKSLGVLLGGSSSHFSTQTNPEKIIEKLCNIPLNRIKRGKYQPRRSMDPTALEELSRSIQAHGVIQPIIVRQLADENYEIIAGERRFRAAELAGLSDIPAIVRCIPDEIAVAVALIENIQRENLNPIEEAIALQRLLDEFSMTHQQVAEAVGKSRTAVTNTLRLLTLSDSVRTLLEMGQIEMGHARTLLTLPEINQIETATIVMQKNLSVRETEALVQRLQNPSTISNSAAVATEPMDPAIQQLQEVLSTRLKLGVAIRCNAKGKGKIVIHYNNLNELTHLVDYFQ